LEKLVRIRIVNQPLIHCRVGTEEMSDEQLVANIDAILSMIYSKTPKHEENIRSVCVKTTMGKSIKIGAPVKADDGGEEQ
jgi:large subunit ribosomal protein L1